MQAQPIIDSSQNKKLYLDEANCRLLLARQGPSLGLWRAAEVAVLRQQRFVPPVLDLGCGDGLVTSLVLPSVAVGLDPDYTALERARTTGIYERFEAVPAEESQLPTASIATVLSNSVLEHLGPIDAVLGSVARLLCPSGRLVFTAPTAAFSRQLALPFASYAAWRNRQLGHLNLWTQAGWAQHLSRVGLRLEATQPYLRPALVWLWDVLDLLQQARVARQRIVGVVWRRLPAVLLDRLAHRLASTNLAATGPSGGCLLVASSGIE